MSNLIVSQINGGPTGVINAIINGNFGINQRAVSGTVTLASGAYGHDRWKAGSGGCTYTFATVANVTTLTITAGTLIQVIEGLNLSSGTYTLSFAGTAQGKIGAGSFAGSGVTGTAVGGTNLNIEFNTGTVSLVQFEQGAVATPFERRPFGAELALCQRYFYRPTNEEGLTTFNVGVVTTSETLNRGYTALPVKMRAKPTLGFTNLRIFDGVAASVVTSISQNFSTTNVGSFVATASGGGLTAGRAAMLIEGSTALSFLDFNAEL